MADKNKGAKHLTDLTLGIEGIKNALDEAQRMIEERSIELGKIAAENLKKGMEESGVNLGTINLGNLGIDEKSIPDIGKAIGKSSFSGKESLNQITIASEKLHDALKRAKDEADELNAEFGKVLSTKILLTDADGEAERIQQELWVSQNERAKAIWEKENEEYQLKKLEINDIQEREKKQAQSEEERWAKKEQRLKKESALREELRKQNQATRDSERKNRESEKQEEDNYQKQIKAIDGLIAKQKALTETAKEKGKNLVNKDDIASSEKLEKELEQLRNTIVRTGRATEETATQTQKYKIEQQELANSIKKTVPVHESFLKQITDKAKWLSAFYIVDAIKQGLVETAKVIKETEDAVVGLQRVLSEDIGKNVISDQLYDISKKYARDFNDVQEVAVKFAQTGATWEDTVKLTESAMLALNTAELDVQQSTEGLIAITSQWNIQADEMQEVIDKINITADKFPVTSEKIIAALQRASSSAKNANLSLGETIGVITALSKATGRSGESIGTAINSILIYTSKSKALETFYEVGNETVKKTVDAYKSGSASILDLWRALSENLKSLGKEQQDALLKGIDFEEMATHLNEESAGILEDIQKVYGVAGTHRQNWFVGLLNDIGTVEEVTNNMTNAIGYSVKENEKYLGTLSAYYTHFKEIWKELAVQLGEGTLGLNVFFKAVLATGSALGTIIKHTGGLANLLTVVAGVLIQIKAQKIQEKVLTPAKKTIDDLKDKTLQFVSAVRTARAAGSSWSQSLKAAGANVDLLVFSLGALQVALGAATAAYSLFTSVAREKREHDAEKRNENIEEAQSILENVENTKKLYEEFEKLDKKQAKTSEEKTKLNRVTWDLAKALRIEAENANGTAKSFDELAESIRNANKAAFSLTPAEWTKYIEDLEKNLSSESKKENIFGLSVSDMKVSADGIHEVSDDIKESFQEILDSYLIFDDIHEAYFDFSGNTKKAYEDMYAIAEMMKDLSTQRDLTEGEKSLFSGLVDKMNQIKESYNAVRKAELEQWKQSHENRLETVKTAEQYKDLIKELSEYLEVQENAKGIIEELTTDWFPNFGSAIEETATAVSLSAEEIESLKSSISSLNNEVDAMQSGINTAYSALDEYRNQGYLSVDMIQSLTNAGLEYANLLEFTDDGIRLNEEATANLINAQRENVLEMIKQSTAAQILELAHKELGIQIKGAKEEGDNLSQGLTGVGAELQNVAFQALNSAMSMEEFRVSMKRALGDQATYSKDAFDNFASGAWSKIEGAKKLYDDLKNVGTVEQYVPAAAKKAEDAVKSRYDAEKKANESAKKAINERYAEEKKQLESQKNAIKEKYNAEINGLKEVQKENSRIDKQEEYIKNKRKAEKEIAKAENRSGVDYREKEQEAREKLEDLETDWNKVLRDWSIEDRIKSLEKMRDAEIANIDAQIKAREKLKEQELENLEKRMNALESEKNARVRSSHQIADEANKTSQQVNKSAKETTVKTTHELADMWYKTLATGSKDMQEKAEVNAKMLYSHYKKGFVAPLSQDLAGIAFQMRHMSPNLPLAGFDFYSKAMSDLNSYKQNPNPIYNNNQTRNAFMVANITGENAAKGITKDFWTMP